MVSSGSPFAARRTFSGMAYPRRDIAKFSGPKDVLITDTVVLAVNRDRLQVEIVNASANDVSLQLATAIGVTPVAVANEGILLKAAGGSWHSTAYTGAINAIAVGGTSRLTVVEI